MAVSEASYSVFIKRTKSLLIVEKLAALLMLKHCKVLKFVLSGQAEDNFCLFILSRKMVRGIAAIYSYLSRQRNICRSEDIALRKVFS
jgi:hypothetical protein